MALKKKKGERKRAEAKRRRRRESKQIVKVEIKCNFFGAMTFGHFQMQCEFISKQLLKF